MVRLSGLNIKQEAVYFGHPQHFWTRRLKLKALLEQECNELEQELLRKQKREECGYCKEKEKRLHNYEQKIEMEKERECLKALEREKIAKGMSGTKEEEIALREMQKLQMEEKKIIEKEEEYKEWMWHQVLLDDVYRKDLCESMAAQRRYQEMLERRKSYDEQIKSANRKRQQILQEERDKENRRLEIMKKKMEQDHFEAIRRKKEQQKENKKNFIEGHEIKISRLHKEKMNDRMIDNETIRVALEGLRRDKERQNIQMRSLQMEKRVCLENYNYERRTTSALREEANKIADEWKRLEEEKTDKYLRKIEDDRLLAKKKAAAAYKEHIRQRKKMEEEFKQERTQRMVAVNRKAVEELEKKISDSEAEIQRQLEYKRDLTEQIYKNQKHMESELQEIENKERAFIKKRVMFKEAMEKRFGLTQSRESSNPVHPFRRIIESNQRRSTQLPFI
ncbi:hypothetical protein K1T71_012687 [Dendrolimus kikuchii]|uniref:Uncharacterized protein n=1 Tax=Dendrolimus kikuchii TaxID=765133 RepID=A0ACC1CKG5_9NEOP|nr:hypothetical protein K1T71_012687 [Dendrolimus kikuchii]